MTDVTFSSNSAGDSGGAVYNDGSVGADSSPILINVTFFGNEADIFGGAMYNNGIQGGKSSPVLTNVTFSGNKATSLGGAIYNICLELGWDVGNCNPQVRNSILWKNMDYSGVGTLSAAINNVLAKTYIANSIVQGAGSSGSSWTTDKNYVDGGGNIDTNPMFITPVEPTKAPISGGNLRLKRGSPAINAGKNGFVTVETDLDGSKRIVDGIVDMGAYEALLNFYMPMIFRR
jgi:predicted outer membrane repeat protein